MTCARCEDEAVCFIQIDGGTMCFCDACACCWWAITLNPPVLQFYGVA